MTIFVTQAAFYNPKPKGACNNRILQQMRVEPEERARLEKLGLWAEFVKHRATCQTCHVKEPNPKTYSEKDAAAFREGILELKELSPEEGKTLSEIERNWEARECSMLDAVMWVGSALGKQEPRKIDSPSPFAWALYETAKRSPLSRQQFFFTVAAKILPSKAQVETVDKRSEKNEVLLEMIERIGKESAECQVHLTKMK